MPKKDVTMTQEVLRAIKLQRDLVLRLKKTAVISSYYKGQYLLSAPPPLPHLTSQQW